MLGIIRLPQGMTLQALLVVALTAGIGFTMSLFIANLAFREGELLELTKISILSASLLAGVAGWILLASVDRAEVDKDNSR